MGTKFTLGLADINFNFIVNTYRNPSLDVIYGKLYLKGQVQEILKGTNKTQYPEISLTVVTAWMNSFFINY
jgi:hypothetical protein